MVEFDNEAVAKTVIGDRDGLIFHKRQPVVFHRSSAAELLAMLLPARAARWAQGRAPGVVDVIPDEFEEIARACVRPEVAITADRAFVAFADLLDLVRRLCSRRTITDTQFPWSDERVWTDVPSESIGQLALGACQAISEPD